MNTVLVVLGVGVLFGYAYSYGFVLGARLFVATFVLLASFLVWIFVILPWLSGAPSSFDLGGSGPTQVDWIVIVGGSLAVLATMGAGFLHGRRYRRRPPKEVKSPVPTQLLLNQRFGVG